MEVNNHRKQDAESRRCSKKEMEEYKTSQIINNNPTCTLLIEDLDQDGTASMINPERRCSSQG